MPPGQPVVSTMPTRNTVSTASTAASFPRSPKRARKEFASNSQQVTATRLQPRSTVVDDTVRIPAAATATFLTPDQPADLSIHHHTNHKDNNSNSGQMTTTTTHQQSLRTPLAVRTTPLRLDTPYSTVSPPPPTSYLYSSSTASPPLNLSAATTSTTSPQQVSPYDYRVTKSAGISGHFQRLKSQDERSGI